jgi:hypothetical protein
LYFCCLFVFLYFFTELNGGSRDGLVVSPNLWAGVGLVRGGAGTALVGSHTEVADRIAEYAALGIDEFILSGYPHLEEAYWFGEGVLPELARRDLWKHPAGPAAAGPAAIPFAGVPVAVRGPPGPAVSGAARAGRSATLAPWTVSGNCCGTSWWT